VTTWARFRRWLPAGGRVTLFVRCGRGEALVTAGPGHQKAAAGRRPRAAGTDHRSALRMVGLATVVYMLRSRRFYQRVVTVAIALGATETDRAGEPRPAPWRGWQPGTNGRSSAWSARPRGRSG
jgi:hypothetical protein